MNTGGKLLAFGEVILRLSPPRGELLLQSPRMDVWVAGAEANVAGQLAALGHPVVLATRLPDNDLGRSAFAALRGRGIDVSSIIFGGDRIGLYFVTPGAGIRATDVLYDRSGSAFAEAASADWDWDQLLLGIGRLHLSGITPALGPAAAESAIAAATAAADRGIPVSFDGNWRGKLWSRWNGEPRSLLDCIVRHADILFGDHRDIALLLGRLPFDGDGNERMERAAMAAFEEYPGLRMIAATSRRSIHVNHHFLGAGILTRDATIWAPELELVDIVDRIGSGDAFVAGVLHGLLSGYDAEAALRDGQALAALKHSVLGDGGAFSQGDLDAAKTGTRDVRR